MKTNKTISILLLAVLILNFAFVKPASASGEVLFECGNLRAALAQTLGKEEIMEDDMAELSGKLDLSHKNITSLAGLEYAVNVRDLVLSFNNITDITPVLRLDNLESLYLDYNWITELPAGKTGLISLEHLDISNNEITELPAGFMSMPKLRRLYAGDIALSTPPDLSAVAGTLDRLDISGARLESFLFVESLANLELLIMNGCGMTELPNLRSMAGLGYLYFSDNEISSLPEYLGSLPLIRLDFSGNLVSGLPQSFADFKRLEQLVMTDNYFETLPGIVAQIKSLEVLMCGQNLIADVPENMSDLNNVKRASFASNNLASLYKFQEFDIPYSYQISFDLNYLDLTDEINLEVLDGYRNDGGMQKEAVLTAETVSADTNALEVKCGLEPEELIRLGESARAEKLMLFRRDAGELNLVGQTDLPAGQAEFTVSHIAPPEGDADYLVCLVIKDTGWPEKYIKYAADLALNINPAPAESEAQTVTEPMAEPTPAVSAEPVVQKGIDSKILLYILLLGVIIIISAIIIHFVFYRRK